MVYKSDRNLAITNIFLKEDFRLRLASTSYALLLIFSSEHFCMFSHVRCTYKSESQEPHGNTWHISPLSIALPQHVRHSYQCEPFMPCGNISWHVPALLIALPQHVRHSYQHAPSVPCSNTWHIPAVSIVLHYCYRTGETHLPAWALTLRGDTRQVPSLLVPLPQHVKHLFVRALGSATLEHVPALSINLY